MPPVLCSLPKLAILGLVSVSNKARIHAVGQEAKAFKAVLCLLLLTFVIGVLTCLSPVWTLTRTLVAGAAAGSKRSVQRMDLMSHFLSPQF